MRRFIRFIDRALDLCGALAFMGMMLVLCLQIFYRYVLESPIVWATPMSMFLFIWGIWFGATSAIRDENQIRVELIEAILPAPIVRVLLPLISLASAAFLLLVISYSFTIIEMQASTVYDTLPFNRDVLFIIVPLLGSVMALQCLRVAVRQWQRGGAAVITND